MVYRSCPVLCSCGYECENDKTVKHNVLELFLCPNCRKQKCHNECKFKIVSKYCPGCNRDYTNSPEQRCNRNCFVCPECSATTKVSASNLKLDGNPGKIFNFSCGKCSYTYSTGVITRPQPLRAILRGQCKASTIFKQFQNDWNEDQFAFKPQISDSSILNMKLSKIPIPQIKPAGPVVIDEQEDHANAFNIKTVETCYNTRAIQFSGSFRKKELQPVARALSATRTVSCAECDLPLLLPPTSRNKLDWNALEFVPGLSVVADSHTLTLGKPYTLYFKVENPRPEAIDVEIHSHRKKGPACNIAVSIPCTYCSITGLDKQKRSDDSVPSKLSAIEQATSSEDVLRGSGWCIFPIVIIPEHKEPTDFEMIICLKISMKQPKFFKLLVPGATWRYKVDYYLNYGTLDIKDQS